MVVIMMCSIITSICVGPVVVIDTSAITVQEFRPSQITTTD